MDQNVLENPTTGTPRDSGRPGGLLKWIIVGLIIVLVIGAGYWYYANYIIGTRGHPGPSPSVEVTEPAWKTKAEKTVSDFLNFYLKSSNTADGQVQSQKAKDYLTIVAQAKLETIKDSTGKTPSDLNTKLNLFVGSSEKAQSFEIVSAKKIDEETVEIKVNLNYAQVKLKVITVKSIDNIWLIDQIRDYQETLVSPSSSILPSPTSS